MLYGKIIAVCCGRPAEHGNSPWAQIAEDINGKAGVTCSYCCVVTVQCSVLGQVVTHNVSTPFSMAKARVLSQASACESLL
jgi:hypothetical protein